MEIIDIKGQGISKGGSFQNFSLIYLFYQEKELLWIKVKLITRMYLDIPKQRLGFL